MRRSSFQVEGHKIRRADHGGLQLGSDSLKLSGAPGVDFDKYDCKCDLKDTLHLHIAAFLIEHNMKAP